MTIKRFVPLIIIALGTFASTSANAIALGTYTLSNHPNGGIRPPLYGLRLDGLLGDPNKEYTFDFDNALSSMELTWDGSTIVIDGQAFGGEDGGTDYVAGTTTVWDIHFEYTVGISSPGGEGGVDDVYVYADNLNFGTITGTIGSTLYSYELEDQSTNDLPTSLAFQLGDESGGGHRGFSGISGWGWLNHGANCITQDCSHVYASDWLFTAELKPVPLPAAAWLFASALGVFGYLGKRRASRT